MYDIIYIGGGLNYAGAIMAAKKGLKVALIEKELDQLGGVCLHKGCIPAKRRGQEAQTAY
ncbi:MAG TPA: NAD(P)/FAD-dependent oxidoreductase, partial [Sulfurimonas sp.]|nr:NAD(P)/FAD-dependent oxidoreductase [Sulfurimonas sp.]